MWSPTHVQVLVKRAKGLKIKGKDGKDKSLNLMYKTFFNIKLQLRFFMSQLFKLT